VSSAGNIDEISRARRTGGARARRSDPSCVLELIDVLSQYPGGLRRWSVMRAIRRARDNAQREIPLKFEDEIERAFRKFCADGEFAAAPADAAPSVLFFRLREKAGEVWAVIPEHAKGWLAGEIVDFE
jgi:hypothetical protein